MEKIITKNQVINTIGTKLGEEFSAIGFRYIKSKKALIRKNKEGFDKITFTTYDTYPISHQELSIGFFKRINIVEDIVNKFLNVEILNPNFKKSTSTVSSTYKLLSGNYNYSYNNEDYKDCIICNQKNSIESNGFILHTENDIDQIVLLLINFIKSKVFPFFEKNNDLDYINHRQKEKNLNPSSGFLPLFPIMHSLVLMKSTNDSDFDSLKKEYIKRFMNRDGNLDINNIEINTIKQLVGYLETYG